MKRVLAIALVSLMLIALLPVSAFAAETKSLDYVLYATMTKDSASADTADISAWVVDPQTKEKRPVALSIGTLKDDATEAMKEAFNKALEDKDAAVKAFTVKNLNEAIDACKDQKIKDKAHRLSILASEPTPIVAAEYPVTISIRIENPERFLFPLTFVNSKWTIPDNVEIVKQDDGSSRAEYEIDGAALISFSSIPNPVPAGGGDGGDYPVVPSVERP